MPCPHPFLLAAVLFAPATLAQGPTGTVTGHVLCADTHRPARLASVYLLPALNPALNPASPTSTTTTQAQPREAPTNVLQTTLDGSFTLPDVHPGSYYVIAEQPGYLSPIAQLSRHAMEHPDKATLALMAQLLTPVTVAANKTATVQVSMYKGAGVSGVVRFDDGSPSVATRVSLLRQDAAGKWIRFRAGVVPTAALSDDRGAFRIAGMPPGKYLVEASIDMQSVTTNGILSGVGSTAASPDYSLTLFADGATRPADAKPFDLSSGEDLTLPDFEIPLAKLHTVIGTLLVGESGVPANAGRVALLYPDDKTELTSTSVSKDDNAFHFLYVPEGTYLLKVTGAKQVSRTEVPNCPSCMPPTHTEEKNPPHLRRRPAVARHRERHNRPHRQHPPHPHRRRRNQPRSRERIQLTRFTEAP